MAVLAIEGHKKLESAQQELFDAFSACFKTVNGRSVETWQPHETIMLCNDTTFFDLAEALRSEISTLTGESLAPVTDVASIAALAKARELHLEGDLTTENLAETVFRTQLLGELLVDLQACRLMAKKYCCTDLRLELSDKATSEAKDLVEEVAKAFGIIAYAARRGGKGAYKGKSSGAQPADEKVQALEEVANKIESDTSWSGKRFDHLLYPYWSLNPEQERTVYEVMEIFNQEYSVRRKVLTRRLDVTIQAFLWSPKADSYMDQISQAIAAVMDWRDHLSSANIGSWHMLATDEKTVQEPPKISSITALKSVVKTIIIGAVPDRGGVPEGYTVEDIAKDIVKANVALTKKDQGGGGKGASAQTAAAMSAKRWVGKGMGESRGGEATEEEDAKNIGRDPPKEKDAASLLQSEEHTEAEKEAEKQKVVAAQLSEEEAALKRQLKQLRAIESKAAGGSPQGSPGHGFAPDPQVAGGSPRSKAERLEASRNPSWRRVNQTDGTVQRDDGVHSESDVSIVEETPDVGELLQPGAGTDMGPTAGGDSSADDSGSASSATNEVKVRRHASVTRQEADHLDDALAKQLEENKVAAQEVEELRQLLETLKNAPVPLAQGTSAAKQESSGPKGEGILPKPIDRDQSGAVTPGSRSQVQLEPVSSPSGSPSRGSKSRRSLAPRRGSVEKPQEETEEQKDQSALKLHELVSACQQLAAEKEGYEKEMASIEEKIRRVKSMDSGGVVELLKKDVQSEKKVDSIEVKELKAEIKKRQSQVNAMRRTWQDMQLSGNRRNALSGAEDEERQRDVAKRFAHVLSFLRASKASELTQEAKKAGLVTESGNAEVVGKTASKFLSAIRKVRVAERPVQDDDGEEGDVPPSPGDGRTPAGSPTGTSPAASRQGFNRLTAEATTGHRGQNLEVPQGQSGQDRVPSPRLPRRASLPLKAPEDEPDTRRRRSFNNILEKAKMKKPKEDNVATPGAKVNSAVRFAPEDAQETPRLRSKSHN